MLAETVHSCADAGNQALLLIGLHASALAPSASHPYGYGKSVYLWSLVSALGTFWLGAGVALHASVTELMGPSMDLDCADAAGGVGRAGRFLSHRRDRPAQIGAARAGRQARRTCPFWRI